MGGISSYTRMRQDLWPHPSRLVPNKNPVQGLIERNGERCIQDVVMIYLSWQGAVPDCGVSQPMERT
jgi:hypothetical protein